MGLHDGLDIDGSDSNAALAKVLGLPVILVVDARGMTRGIAPLILGYQAFDRDVRIAGVILNNLKGSRHEAKLRLVIEHYTDVKVLGAVHCDPRLAIVERHLGLMPSNEADRADERVAAIGSIVGRQVDLDGVLRAAADVRPLAAAQPVALPALPAAESICASVSRRIVRSVSTMRTTSTRCERPARRSSASTRWRMRSFPMWTDCLSAAAFRRSSPPNSRPMRRCARASEPRSTRDCRSTPNAVGSCTWPAR